MSSKTAKTACSIISTVALASGAAVAFAPCVATADTVSPDVVSAEVASSEAPLACQEKVTTGVFSYTQNTITSTGAFKEVFAKAAATMCSSMPQYGAMIAGKTIGVTTPTRMVAATLGDLADEDGAQAIVLGCSCATNAPGGGAIANVGVEGVSLASVASQVGVL